jgi:IS605 OrfB family transposase
MKFIRSTRCSIADATISKHGKLSTLLAEYGRVTNFFIDKWWGKGLPPAKGKLLKDEILVPGTWLTARLRKVAAREAVDMIRASRERDGMHARKPEHKGRRMHVSSTIASLSPASSATSFDAWLHIASVGRGMILDLPIRFHRHYRRYASDQRARRLESYIITKDYVQFAFEVEAGETPGEGAEYGLDTGINALATLSDGRQFGIDIKKMIERVKRCEHGSKGQGRARAALRQRMAEVAKEVIGTKPSTIVIEDLKFLSRGTRTERRLSRNMRRSLGAWAYRDWLGRVEMACEANRVRLERVPPAYTSQRCHVCGHTERGNRKGEEFCCLKCGYTGNADVNAARNLLIRFKGDEPNPTRAYGPGLKPGA